MKKELEIEFKTELTENEYNLILPLFNDCYYQTNNYFDTINRDLLNQRIVCRIREKNNLYELTFKTKNKVGVNEYNQIISKETFDEYINNGFNADYDFIKIDDLKFLAKNTTLRYELELNGQLFCLDKVFIKDLIHYELEMETPNYEQGLIEFNKFLSKYNIEYKKCISKSKRTLQNL